MPFAGFGPDALPFLKALAFHQTREWFEANKAVYESQLKTPMGDLVEDLAARFAEAKIPLKGDRKASIFRIHRDVRFAKDKSPYKTHIGAVLTRTGAKDDPGLLYLHVAPDGGFAAAGFHAPAPETLAKLRGAMARAPEAWRRALADLAKAGLAPDAAYATTRPPRGFASVADEEAARGIKLKSIVVRRPFDAARLGDAGLVAEMFAAGRDALPLLRWGWDALSDARSS